MKSQKYYVVWKGRRRGIYTSWKDCSEQVNGFTGALYKSFETRAEAESAFQGTSSYFMGSSAVHLPHWKSALIKPAIPSICVDAACSGVPGPLEWRGVETDGARQLFHSGPFPDGTNNVGEFLAIVRGLSWLAENNLAWPVYSDSNNAILWVKIKKCRTKLAHTRNNAPLFELISRAETWLNQNKVPSQVLKWETRTWGENPADFGRK